MSIFSKIGKAISNKVNKSLEEEIKREMDDDADQVLETLRKNEKDASQDADKK